MFMTTAKQFAAKYHLSTQPVGNDYVWINVTQETGLQRRILNVTQAIRLKIHEEVSQSHGQESHNQESEQKTQVFVEVFDGTRKIDSYKFDESDFTPATLVDLVAVWVPAGPLTHWGINRQTTGKVLRALLRY